MKSSHADSVSFSNVLLVYAVFQANADHKRMTAIKNIVTRSTYREEIVGSGLRDYFLQGRHIRLMTPASHDARV